MKERIAVTPLQKPALWQLDPQVTKSACSTTNALSRVCLAGCVKHASTERAPGPRKPTMVGGAPIVYHQTVSTGSIDIMTSELQATIAGEAGCMNELPPGELARP